MPLPEARLTRRQLQVLRLLASGAQDEDIAHRLRISGTTVRQHLHGAFRRLDVSSRTEAFVALGWLRVPNI